MEKALISTEKTTINTYDDGTVVKEMKLIKGEEVKDLGQIVSQDKLTRKKQAERTLLQQDKISVFKYEDGSSLTQHKVYELVSGEKKLVKDIVVTQK